MERFPEEADRLADLLFLALAHGVSSVEYGGPLIPFVITQSGGERTIHRFLDERPEGLSVTGSVEGARAYARGLAAMVEGWVLAYEDQVDVEGARRPAIVAEAHDPRSGASLRYAQPYRPKRLFRKGHAVGNPVPLSVELP
jgi:hypothetical protein